jgi:hypothetical protein
VNDPSKEGLGPFLPPKGNRVQPKVSFMFSASIVLVVALRLGFSLHQ